MPSYHNAAAARAAAYGGGPRRSSRSERRHERPETATCATRSLLAMVLFLTALAQRFHRHRVRLTPVGISGALLVVAIIFFALYPRA